MAADDEWRVRGLRQMEGADKVVLVRFEVDHLDLRHGFPYQLEVEQQGLIDSGGRVNVQPRL